MYYEKQWNKLNIFIQILLYKKHFVKYSIYFVVQQ